MTTSASGPDDLPIARLAWTAIDCPDPRALAAFYAAEARAIAIGARRPDLQPSPQSWRVLLDPADHPFCLIRS